MGDNILVHMNKDEADTLAKAAGLEKLPINPKTGMPEAFAIMGALMVGKGVLGAVSAISGANDASKVGGIVYGGNSRKIRNYLQISNKLFVFNNSKNDIKIGYFKTELIKPVSPKYFNDKKRISALISLCSLLNLLLPDSQPYKYIYKSFNHLF